MIDPIILLKQVFPDLDPESLTAMQHYARIQTYPPETLLCTEGAEESVFYVVADGEVAVTKRFAENSEERLLRRSGPGDFFGEMALITNQPRAANVRTLVETVVLEIDKPMFIEIMRQSPSIALTMFRTAVNRLRANDQQAMGELYRQKQQIEQAYEKLSIQERQRSEFLTTLSHELRTPLTSANGFMQLVKDGKISGPALGMAHEKISNGLDQVVSLINDLLFVQEMDLIEPALKYVDLNTVLQRIIENSSNAAEDNGIEVRLEKPDTLPTLKADPDGLTRALQAILDNAIKFSLNGGLVLIKLTVDEARLNVAIRDEGIGITPEFLPYIFDRFRRIDSYQDHMFGGMGLGLAIAKHLIESCGGSISVQSVLEQGSTFTVHLPILLGQAPAEGSAAS